jgi:sensor histidine kinase regulating citrate/malate metabolism
MKIRNYYNNQLKFNNNNIVTSKNNDNNEHGFGIKSMKCIAHKYNGDIYINHNNNIFSLTLYFRLSI